VVELKNIRSILFTHEQRCIIVCFFQFFIFYFLDYFFFLSLIEGFSCILCITVEKKNARALAHHSINKIHLQNSMRTAFYRTA
jgi:hypothetical protein